MPGKRKTVAPGAPAPKRIPADPEKEHQDPEQEIAPELTLAGLPDLAIEQICSYLVKENCCKQLVIFRNVNNRLMEAVDGLVERKNHMPSLPRIKLISTEVGRTSFELQLFLHPCHASLLPLHELQKRIASRALKEVCSSHKKFVISIPMRNSRDAALPYLKRALPRTIENLTVHEFRGVEDARAVDRLLDAGTTRVRSIALRLRYQHGALLPDEDVTAILELLQRYSVRCLEIDETSNYFLAIPRRLFDGIRSLEAAEITLGQEVQLFAGDGLQYWTDLVQEKWAAGCVVRVDGQDCPRGSQLSLQSPRSIGWGPMPRCDCSKGTFEH